MVVCGDHSVADCTDIVVLSFDEDSLSNSQIVAAVEEEDDCNQTEVVVLVSAADEFADVLAHNYTENFTVEYIDRMVRFVQQQNLLVAAPFDSAVSEQPASPQVNTAVKYYWV